jgi:hypothetical protein
MQQRLQPRVLISLRILPRIVRSRLACAGRYYHARYSDLPQFTIHDDPALSLRTTAVIASG